MPKSIPLCECELDGNKEAIEPDELADSDLLLVSTEEVAQVESTLSRDPKLCSDVNILLLALLLKLLPAS